MCKSVQIFYYVKKRLVWVFYNRGDQAKDNATGLKEGGGIEMSTTVLPYTRCSLSSLLYLLTDYDLDHQVHHFLVKQDRRGATFYTLDHWHISLHFVTNPNTEW